MTDGKLRSRHADYVRPDVLASPEWLEENLHKPDVRVVEVDVSSRSYDAWHIESAVLWNVYVDLKDADYRLLTKGALEQLLSRSGIGPQTNIVFYGYAPAMAFWLLQLFGHTNCRVLDYGKEQWRNDGRPWTTRTTPLAPTSYSLKNEDPRLRADMARVGRAIGDPGVMLLDVRGQAEYDGACFWPSGGAEPGGRQGHIPSARHQPLDDLHDQTGAFQPRARLEQLLGRIPDDCEQMISYCTIGGRACTAWFVLTYLLGRENVSVYDGSWAEWGRAPETAVA